MSESLPQLVILSIGGSIAPLLLLLTNLFLGSREPLPNATSLALGYFTTCAAMGIVGLTLFGGAESVASTIGRVISAMVGSLLIVLGLRSLLRPQGASWRASSSLRGGTRDGADSISGASMSLASAPPNALQLPLRLTVYLTVVTVYRRSIPVQAGWSGKGLGMGIGW